MEQPVYKSIYLHERDHWWYLGMRRIMEVFLSTFLPKNSSPAILDAGCGAGTKGEMLSHFGGELRGIDTSSEAVAFSRSTGKYEEILQASVEKIPYRDESFDIVNCNDVLYHRGVKNDEQALREFMRVLRPGGLLFLREAAYDWLRGHNDKVVWVERRYTKRQLKEKLEQSGFQVVHATYVNCLLFPLALVTRTFERITGRDDVPKDIYAPPLLP